MAKCRKCGAEICFVRTRAGKAIPVYPGSAYYIADRNGDVTIITSNGEAVKGVVVDGFLDILGDIKPQVGRAPHKCNL